MTRILVLDDDPQIVRTLEIMLRHDGHDVLTASSGEEALERLEKDAVDIALVDLQLPGISGTEVLRKLRDKHRGVETVIITAYGSIETAVEAMKEGAFDYLTKPFSPEQVRHRLRQIQRLKHLEREVAGLQRRVGELPYGRQFLTQNPQVLHLLEVAREVARSDATILITGETGTGKTLLARLIHESSRRHEGPFATVDCTSFHESLLESELFGHKRGAFTGAVADKAGKIETAAGGTLFLDEIGELALSPQAKLLRLVEERTYERLGDPRPLTIDVRIVAATNRDLEDMVREKSFRQDLYFRLSVVDLHIHALRHRPEDILLLAREFLTSFARAHEKNVSDWDEEARRAIVRYSWPGNARELANAVERAVLMAPGRVVRLEHLPPRLREERSLRQGDELVSLSELEERHLRKALSLGLSQEETARRLGIDPSTLWRKRKKYGL
jgi:NtrC-family two-component system response regulator AlgB